MISWSLYLRDSSELAVVHKFGHIFRVQIDDIMSDFASLLSGVPHD